MERREADPQVQHKTGLERLLEADVILTIVGTEPIAL